MPTLNNLRKLLNKRGEQEKLSKAIGVSSGNISDWFNPNKSATPNATTLCKIANHFECSVDYILDRTNNPNILHNTKIYRFPVYDQQAAAGIGVLGSNDHYNMEDYIIDGIPDEAVFAMKIKGDSMYVKDTGHIKDNAIVLINPKDTYYENKIVIVSLGTEIICKRYSTVNDHVEFKSDNNDRQEENKDSRDYGICKVIGVVLGVIENERFIKIK